MKERMEQLRERLNHMIESGEYSDEEILEVSMQLDFLILQSIKEKRPGQEKENTIPESREEPTRPYFLQYKNLYHITRFVSEGGVPLPDKCIFSIVNRLEACRNKRH